MNLRLQTSVFISNLKIENGYRQTQSMKSRSREPRVKAVARRSNET